MSRRSKQKQPDLTPPPIRPEETGATDSGELLRDPLATTFEACERRLVLSAQLLFDALGDQALDMHGGQVEGPMVDLPEGVCHNPLGGDLETTGLDHPSTIGWIPTESHMREAHQATGWNDVQSQYGLTGKGQTVAVIDSGIAWDHTALGGGLGSGYRVVGGWDFTEENDALPYDDGPFGFHGTHVSGIIASDDPVHTGVAPEVDLVGLRVFNDAGQGQLAWVEQALAWVHENKDSFENPITTVNLSLGTSWNSDSVPDWATLEEEFQALYEDGIVVTASAGNSFAEFNAPGLSYPAASSYVLPVASVDDDGSLSDFSQRHSRALAAPGGNIVSTVPDHVLGTDGNVNDFSTASGTSMAAPYVAGASVLVREAMEMVGVEDINLTKIADHLRDTSDSIFDAVTGANYDRLDLQAAIDALIPADSVGDNAQTADVLDLGQSQIGGWMNSLADTDVYRWTASASGSLGLSASSDWVDSLAWTISTAGETLADGTTTSETVELIEGQTYELHVHASNEIGPFSLGLDFVASPDGEGGGESGGTAPPPSGPVTMLGEVRYLHDDAASSGAFQVQAAASGTLTVQWNTSDATGQLFATPSGGTTSVDGNWSDGVLRVDVEVQAGQIVDFIVPGDHVSGQLSIANVLHVSGGTATVTGTSGSDDLAIDLSQGTQVRFEDIQYTLPGQVSQLTVIGHVGNDSLELIGSSQSDTVELRPTGSRVDNQQISIDIVSTEEIAYSGGGGRDRVYLYDSDQDDTLRASPRHAELAGVGYNFKVDDIDRIFIHATGGGQDYAYLNDSDGDDRLSMRPQFTSMSGDNFFNYVRGFERVYAYASGGTDEALLYDSAGDDRFATGGASASIVGPGFSSFSRSFDSVQAIAESGGEDLATLYGSSSQVQWEQASDFVEMRDGGFSREARGFGTVETYVAGQAHTLGSGVESGILGASSAEANTAFPNAASPNAAADSSESSGLESGQLAGTDFAQDNLPGSAAWNEDVGDSRLGPSDPMVFSLDAIDEHELLDSVTSLQDWLADEDDWADRRAEEIDLPDSRFVNGEELEDSLLDEIFGQFDRFN